MTDQQYYDCYAKLASNLVEYHELDRDLFYAIFEGKIKPIIKNTFFDIAGSFTSIDLEDVCQDIFIKLWTRCVGAYFMNEKYETNAAMFLGWCKIVAKNHVTSLLRKKSLRPSETLDDPDHPIVVADMHDPSSELIRTEAVRAVFRAASALPSKAELKLTWFSVYLLIYSGEASDRIEATHMFCERYADAALGDVMRDVESRIADLCDLSDVKDEIERGRSDEPLGELLGDEPLAKVSDWLYKINKRLANSLPSEVVQWNT